MRIYANCYELMSELFREVWEMGHIVKPNTMQNKVVIGDENYVTREVMNYSYCLTNLFKSDYLFWADKRSRGWANAEFSERIYPKHVNPGIAWKLREDIWEEFMTNGRFDYTYNERMGISMETVIHELEVNPDTRQAIVSIWEASCDIEGIGGNKRVPCSMYYQFLIRNNQLCIIYNQRSADIVTHFGNDVYLAWKLMEYVASRIKVKPGYLFHNIGSLHSYKKDWPLLKQCIETINV